ncbi:MAG TPA: hypothetical protein VK436_16205 [Methanocella sp.]|nr:hypothetical protein [Methanocella sp.]
MLKSSMCITIDTIWTAYPLVLYGATRKHPDVRFMPAHAGGTVQYLTARAAFAVSTTPIGQLAIPKDLEFYLRKFYYDTARLRPIHSPLCRCWPARRGSYSGPTMS